MIEPIVDVSHWQGDIDAQTMVSKAIGMYIRAGSIDNNSGICYEDYRLRENCTKFSENIPCGYYWYFRPNHDGFKQGEYFATLIKNASINLPPMVDVETPAIVWSQYYKDQLIKFLTVVDRHLSSTICGIYTRGYFWNDYIKNFSVPVSHRPLWIARYNDVASHPWDVNQNSKLRPSPWIDYKLWQWTDKGSGFGEESSYIDLNRFNGTLEEFYRFANWNQPAPENGYCKIIMTIKKICDNFLREHCE